MVHTVAVSAPIDLNLLTVFVQVAELTSFSRAAGKLGLKRSSVSRAISSLEAALGVQLFSRTTRQVALTGTGKTLYAKVSGQLTALHNSLGTLPERDPTPSGLLRLSAPNDIGWVLLPGLLAGFSMRYPAVQIDLRLSNRVVDLVADGYDAALRIAMTQLADSSLLARRLCALEIQMYASPSYLARNAAPQMPADVAKHRFIAMIGMKLTPLISLHDKRPMFQSDDILFVWGAIRAGLGIGMLPTFLAQDDVAAGALVRVLPRLSVPSGTLYLVHPPANHVPRKVLAFRDYMVEYLATRPLCPNVQEPPR